MKKIVIIPDSFKGTMSSRMIGEIIAQEASDCWPGVETLRVEVADGGEGSVDAFLSVLPGTKHQLTVQGPYGEPIQSFYGQMGDTAVIEMAAAAGLPLVGEKLNAGQTSTYGVGQLICHALENGARKIILGLGGSATNDGGAGAAAALGVRFLDSEGKSFVPVGNTLHRIQHIEMHAAAERLKNVSVVAMCDINNPLCGPQGAAAVFGPQKGASPEQVVQLDAGLHHLADVIQRDLGIHVLQLPGGGAAGGMGAGAAAFFGAALESGIDVVLDTVDFDQMLEGCSMVITGEGRIDGQSARGKVIAGIAQRAQKKNVPVVAIVGDIADGAEQMYSKGVSAIFSINRVALPFIEMKHRAPSDLRQTVRNVFRFVKLAKEIQL